MTEIKSALEIALEKTREIKGDKETLTANELKNAGRRLASTLIDPHDDTSDPIAKLKSYAEKERKSVRDGFVDVLLANFNLPTDDTYAPKLTLMEKGFQAIMRDRRQVSYIMQQVKQFYEQYLQNRSQLRERVKEQYAPRLREKEEAIAKQLGTQVKLDPESDPEFGSLLARNYGRLEEQYNEALQQVRDELRRIYDKEK